MLSSHKHTFIKKSVERVEMKLKSYYTEYQEPRRQTIYQCDCGEQEIFHNLYADLEPIFERYESEVNK